jgi:hypothetical protein
MEKSRQAIKITWTISKLEHDTKSWKTFRKISRSERYESYEYTEARKASSSQGSAT